EGTLERLELTHEQRASTRNAGKACDSVGTRLRPVRGAEGIHHEYIAERRHFPGEIFLVFLFTLVEAHVLAEHGAPGRTVDTVEPVLTQRDRLAEQLRQPHGYRLQRQGLVELA